MDIQNEQFAQRKLPIEWLQRGQYQPRRYFNQAKLIELSETIKQQGLIQPIVARPISEKQYEILAGERRWRAAQLAGLHEVPVLIRNDVDDEKAIEIAIIENIQREDLNPLEEAEIYDRLNYEFGYTHEEIGHKIGKDRATITNKLRLLKLDEKVKQLLLEGDLLEGFGIQLASLPMEYQYKYACLCVKNGWSIRKVQKEIRNLKQQLQNNTCEQIKKYYDPDIKRLEQSLSEKFGTNIEIKNKNSGAGQIIIDYSDPNVFEGLLEKLGYNSDGF